MESGKGRHAYLRRRTYNFQILADRKGAYIQGDAYSKGFFFVGGGGYILQLLLDGMHNNSPSLLGI